VSGIYTNGMTEVVAQVALAAFANPDGLNRVGGNLFSVGANSGNAMIGAAQTAERGAIRGGALETSNVELTEEFTKMIVAQRSYQANSRVITKADALLEELIQIVR
jgi:flagellar hook protein FlgE